MGVRDGNAQVGIRRRGGKVEGEDEWPAAVDEAFGALVKSQLLDERVRQQSKAAVELLHGRIEAIQGRVAQVRGIDEGPLAAGILEGVAVARSGEVYPLRMAELVAHEIEVS